MASWPGNVFGQATYLLVAPLVPVLGVAGAFAATDPINAITQPDAVLQDAVDPAPGRRRRGDHGPAGRPAWARSCPASACWPWPGWGPALGLTLSALVGLTWWSPAVTTTGLSIVWATVVGVAYQRHELTAAIERDAQIGYLVVAAITAAALVARIRSAHTPGGYA